MPTTQHNTKVNSFLETLLIEHKIAK